MSSELTNWFLDEANKSASYKSESAADESNIIKSTINIACYNLNSNLLMIGSGLIIDPLGYVITNKHVTVDSDTCNIYYSKEIGSGANISIGQKALRVSESDSSDLAIFKIEGYNKNNYVDLSKSVPIAAIRVTFWISL